MKLENRRQLADKVLAIIREKIRKHKATNEEYLSLGSYQNGREQGHSLDYLWLKKTCTIRIWIAWSEYRSTDQVVVYQDTNDPMQGLSEEAHKNRVLLDTPEKAADHIFQKLFGRGKK